MHKTKTTTHGHDEEFTYLYIGDEKSCLKLYCMKVK